MYLILNLQEIMNILYIFICYFGNMDETNFLSGSSTNAPNLVIPVTVPSNTLPTSIAMLLRHPPLIMDTRRK